MSSSLGSGRPFLLERQVGAEEDGARADVVVAAWLDEPRSRSQARLGAGEVLVAGEPAPKSRRLRAGENVAVVAPPPSQPDEAVPPRVPIRHEDGDLVVVAKPAGLVVHPGAGTTGPTLVDSLAAAGIDLAPGADASRPGIVHRLDRGTSGLLVVAKTRRALEGLMAMLRDRTVTREYDAIVDGVPAEPSATIDAPIARSTTARTRYAVDPGGRPAVTHYDLAEAFGRACLMTARLETGRTHQVRVHLAAIGHPVSGDLAYGADRTVAADLGLIRPALHARRLAFAHPVTGEPVDVREPLPDDLEAALDVLRGGAGGPQ